jgi:acyl CoA:acetate/3-ketoacid CoA transferase beta subunit
MLTREQMARRAACEIGDGERAFFGPGLPQAVKALAPKSDASEGPYDLAFVEALHVGANGALTLPSGHMLPSAGRVVALIPHTLDDGAARILAKPDSAGVVAARLITDRAVIDIRSEGLILRELESGLSAADVQALTAAPLLAEANLAVIAV